MCLNTAEWLVFSLVLNTPLATRPLRFPVAECSMSREWVPLCFGTSRVTGELWLLGTLFGFMGHIQQPLTLKNGKSAYKWMHYCGRKKKTKKKASVHKSIILIGITSPQLVGAPAGLRSSSDKWKAAVWIQRRPVISQNTRTTTAFCIYRPFN